MNNIYQSKRKNKTGYYLLTCCALVAVLCLGHIFGSVSLIMLSLGGFMLLLLISFFKGIVLPVLLFFLPWSPLLKTAYGSMTMFTIGLFTVALLYFLYNRSRMNFTYLVFSFGLFVVTALSKVVGGIQIQNAYILFMAMIFLFPSVLNENRAMSDYFTTTLFFATGIITASFSAKYLVVFPAIARFVQVFTIEQLSITRLSGFYGDANFYSAHIAATLGAIMILLLNEKSKRRIAVMAIAAILLLYCGAISASKSFVIVFFIILMLWIVGMLFSSGKVSGKIAIMFSVLLLSIFVLSSTVFSESINVILTRFGQADDFSSLTTGRIDIWDFYVDAIISSPKRLFIGEGFSQNLINNRASHNTLLQFVYELGIFGTVLIIMWIVSFFKQGTRVANSKRINFVILLVLLIGTFGQWLSLDALYFDEFFLMQFFAITGIRYLKNNSTYGEIGQAKEATV